MGQSGSKNAPRKKTPLPAQDISLAKHLSADPIKIEERKVYEIAELLSLPASLDLEEQQTRVRRAIEFYEALAPTDGLEGMLAAQMVGTHHAALECLRRAANPEQSFEGRDMNLKQAQKLMTLYAQQVAALNKHRGKGQQKVTVEHATVQPGGQAIVGSVETMAKSDNPRPEPIEHGPVTPLPKVKRRARVPSDS